MLKIRQKSDRYNKIWNRGLNGLFVIILVHKTTTSKVWEEGKVEKI